jgi:hypothetical protein
MLVRRMLLMGEGSMCMQEIPHEETCYALVSLHSCYSEVLAGSLKRQKVPSYILFPTLVLQGLAPVLPFLLWLVLVPGGHLYDMRERRLRIVARNMTVRDKRKSKKALS